MYDDCITAQTTIDRLSDSDVGLSRGMGRYDSSLPAYLHGREPDNSGITGVGTFQLDMQEGIQSCDSADADFVGIASPGSLLSHPGSRVTHTSPWSPTDDTMTWSEVESQLYLVLSQRDGRDLPIVILTGSNAAAPTCPWVSVFNGDEPHNSENPLAFASPFSF